jgi:hypothetical protein
MTLRLSITLSMTCLAFCFQSIVCFGNSVELHNTYSKVSHDRFSDARVLVKYRESSVRTYKKIVSHYRQQDLKDSVALLKDLKPSEVQPPIFIQWNDNEFSFSMDVFWDMLYKDPGDRLPPNETLNLTIEHFENDSISSGTIEKKLSQLVKIESKYEGDDYFPSFVDDSVCIYWFDDNGLKDMFVLPGNEIRAFFNGEESPYFNYGHGLDAIDIEYRDLYLGILSLMVSLPDQPDSISLGIDSVETVEYSD